MPQLDVYRQRDGSAELLLDCQSDTFSAFATRVMAPLVPRDASPALADRLTPVFAIDGHDYVLIPQLLTAVAIAELGPCIGSLAQQGYTVQGAFDLLFSGI